MRLRSQMHRRTLVALGRTLFLFGAALGVAGAPSPVLADQQAGECIPREQCCKVCSKGKACGNTCISRAYTCHKGRGCACDEEEVCE